ncbi:MAG: 2-succinyl-6-hydroxy-2,4-cyclohexadiene-1-carboxylate synthase [SAR324 cluster bacterium]|nr:2-succinyl-6-hydroxy-2,4-cyclohexadiene-1-carboxylate synthase [SAR324 cluster bacterium]
MKLFYQIYGNPNRPAVLFLHGFLGSHSMWVPSISSLQEKFFCILVDLPGHGDSPIPGSYEAYSLPLLADALATLLGDLQITSCSLVGYSLGGRIALQLALSHQYLVEKLILESSSPGLKSVKERKKRIEADEQWAAKLEQLAMNKFLEQWYDQEIFASLKKHPDFTDLIQKRADNDGPRLAKSLRAMSVGKQASLWNELSDLRAKLSMITGTLDYKYQQIFRQMQALVPNAQILLVENAGHNTHFEQAEDFAAILNDVL